MIKSMTGYGKAVAEISGKKISIEIRSLNSKSLDISTRLPWLYKEKEADIRALINQKLDRGKIDLTINSDVIDNDIVPLINKEVVKAYFNQLKEIADEIGIEANEQLLPVILKLPDAMKTEKPDLSENEWLIVKTKIEESIASLDLFRTEEGRSLEDDLKKSVNKILTLLEEVVKFEEKRIGKIREKLNKSLTDMELNESIDKNRFEQELIYYLEKLDINEEKVRLKKTL
jgi:uncharacterized protein (TIGR00255 family)